jgi:tetraacyldisaccharide 4'-kinase
MTPQEIHAILSGESRTLGAMSLRCLLAAAEPGYALAMTLRNIAFDRRWRKVHNLGRRTISVGNLTTGGTGKTPFVIDITRRLVAKGKRPAVLLRGYRGRTKQDKSSQSIDSDEAQMLAAELGPEVPVHANPDRVAGAAAVLRSDERIDTFVLDDAFQHRRAARDLDIVLIDATLPWGLGHVLPRGLLREPVRGLRRADAVVITRADRVDERALEKLASEIRTITGREPTAVVSQRWTGLREGASSRTEVSSIRGSRGSRGSRVLGLCAIGNPQQFFDTLAAECDLVDRLSFADHHHFTEADISTIAQRARTHQAQALVMTEKDWVKFGWLLQKPQAAEQLASLKILRPELGMHWHRGLEEVEKMISGR